MSIGAWWRARPRAAARLEERAGEGRERRAGRAVRVAWARTLESFRRNPVYSVYIVTNGIY
jgi:hypothetical protein